MPRAPRARAAATSAPWEQGSHLPRRSSKRGAGAEDDLAKNAPAEPLRPQPTETFGADLEAAASSTPLARTCDDYDDRDDELDELDAAGTGAPQARLLGAAGARAPGRALLNGDSPAEPLAEPESSITSRDFSKEGSVVFRVAPCPF